ncbi:sugar phosphate isomerase/epimerase family protein [Oceanobacillus manasiensis]|uniref:sugar phosphate isomerase/epimerase family protein n=1 Tax=Oceanobacillus manasiensis TaxID=586413 RepID=UPI0005AA98D2|nr:sugar phosphate isomerase/epimerase [Oceanobacillus manasiensis]
MGKIGLQLYTVRDSAEANFHQLLRDVGEIGYEGAQFAGFYDTEAKDVADTLQSVGITPAGAHVPIEQLQHHLQDVIQYHKAIGNNLIICPYLPESMRENKAGYLQTAELFNQIGKELKQAGFQFAYHNHAFEFDRIEDTTGFKLLFENTDPNLVKMELDCFWATYAGYDPNEIMRDYKTRCISLHLKDIREENGEKISTEIGNGTLDMKTLIQSGLDHNVEWFIIEQEHFTGDPLESAKKNVEALKEML